MVAEEHDDSGRAGGFDPRFDPAFQRGYQPQPGERPQTRASAADAPDSAYRRPASLLAASRRPRRATADRAVAAGRRRLRCGPRGSPTRRASSPRQAARDDRRSTVSADPRDRRSPAPASSDGWTSARAATRSSSRCGSSAAGFVVLGIVLYCISVRRRTRPDAEQRRRLARVQPARLDARRPPDHRRARSPWWGCCS